MIFYAKDNKKKEKKVEKKPEEFNLDDFVPQFDLTEGNDAIEQDGGAYFIEKKKDTRVSGKKKKKEEEPYEKYIQ